jgi:hypothetical protein
MANQMPFINSREGCFYGGVVTVVYFKPLAIHCYWFESSQGLWILSYDESIQITEGKLVVLLWCLIMPEIMHRGGTVVFTSKAGMLPYNLYTVGVT